MSQKKVKKSSKEKTKAKLHPRNKHQGRYNLTELSATSPSLAKFVKTNPYGDESIDFANPEAVKELNKALLLHLYNIKNWDIPANYLCPAIPGRADYIHNIADLLAESNSGVIPTGKKIKCLDIGIGANCVYPIIGSQEYGWSFIGADIDELALKSASAIINLNPNLTSKVKLRAQPNPKNIFPGVLEKTERIHVSICNPPFYASYSEAQAASLKKLNNLNKDEKVTEVVNNFGGQSKELWCQGGEGRFLKDMIFQSQGFANSCLWFTTLVSNQAHLQPAYNYLKQVEAVNVKTLAMGQGNKVSRLLAWTFQTPERHKIWFPNQNA